MKEVITEKSKWGDVWTTLLVKDDVVGLKTSTLIRGTNRYSGKTYARFQTDANHFYSWRNGRLRVYSKSGRGIRDVTHLHTAGWETTPRSGLPGLRDTGFQMALGKNYGEVVADHYPLITNFHPAPGIMAHLAQPNVQEFTRSFFGKSNYRKDLVRRVAGLSENLGPSSASTVLQVAKGFNNLVPIDWLVNWMTTSEDGQKPLRRGRVMSMTNPTGLREMLKTADQSQLRRLLKDNAPALTGLGDTIQDFRRLRSVHPEYEIRGLNFRTFQELHDEVVRDATKIHYALKEIEYAGRAKKLPGDYGDIQIIAPKDTHTLVEWSQEMSNCISGYGDAAYNGRTLLYAVMKDGKMVANMELAPKTGDIRQLLGKYNAHLDPDLAGSIKDAIHTVWERAEVDGGWQ